MRNQAEVWDPYEKSGHQRDTHSFVETKAKMNKSRGFIEYKIHKCGYWVHPGLTFLWSVLQRTVILGTKSWQTFQKIIYLRNMHVFPTRITQDPPNFHFHPYIGLKVTIIWSLLLICLFYSVEYLGTSKLAILKHWPLFAGLVLMISCSWAEI